jgi:hypothetical protein
MIHREWYQMDDTSGVISSYHPIADLAIALLGCISLSSSAAWRKEKMLFSSTYGWMVSREWYIELSSKKGAYTWVFLGPCVN